MRLLLSFILLVFSLNCSADYLRLNGLSWHDTPGNNAINYGAGYEYTVDDRWSVMGGWYRNSEYHGSWYGAARYAFYKDGDWNLGVGIGAVTGYTSYKVVPVAIPDFCYKYYCFLAAPKVESTGSNVIGFSVRLPIE